jgi:hypothetical protein
MDAFSIKVTGKDIDVHLSLSPNERTDRFERRLGKYRCHQSNCMGSYKNGHNEMCEQQNYETSILQSKLRQENSKQKKINKRGSRRQHEIIKIYANDKVRNYNTLYVL